MTRVYFACGIVQLTPKQEEELEKIYEEPLLIKLQLGRKFPRAALYSRLKALGVGLMKPTTVLAAMAARLYIANTRSFNATSKLIKASENYDMIIQGKNTSDLYKSKTVCETSSSWTQNIGYIFNTRNISLKNHHTEEITSNKTIMDYAKDYTYATKVPKYTIDRIN